MLCCLHTSVISNGRTKLSIEQATSVKISRQIYLLDLFHFLICFETMCAFFKLQIDLKLSSTIGEQVGSHFREIKKYNPNSQMDGQDVTSYIWMIYLHCIY